MSPARDGYIDVVRARLQNTSVKPKDMKETIQIRCAIEGFVLTVWLLQ